MSKAEEVETSSFLGRTWLGMYRVWDILNRLGYQMLVGNWHGAQDLRTRRKVATQTSTTG